MRVCAISVDLDEIHHYYAIHGLGPPPPAAAHQVYDTALARYRDFASAERLPLSLFAVGADLARAESGDVLRRLAELGHEIGNHIFDHNYNMSRGTPPEIASQITQASEAIFASTGARPSGVRAPGYVMSDEVYAAVADAGLSYSSSVFPCPYYYLAKLAKLGELRLRGRSSGSIQSGPAVLLAPLVPYRVGRPYWRAGQGVLELPIGVTPWLRVTPVAISEQEQQKRDLNAFYTQNTSPRFGMPFTFLVVLGPSISST